MGNGAREIGKRDGIAPEGHKTRGAAEQRVARLNIAWGGGYNSLMQPAAQTTAEERRKLMALNRADLERHQVAKFNALLDRVLPENKFYAQKIGAGEAAAEDRWQNLAEWPFTFKEELVGSRKVQRRGQSSHLAGGAIFAVSSDLRHQRAADGRARHGGRLAVGVGMLGIRAGCGRSAGGGSGDDGVFVWAAPRFLERLRGAGQSRGACDRRRRDEFAATIGISARTAPGDHLLHSQLCAAPDGIGHGSTKST